MAKSSTIREYLVRLGVSTDAAGIKKFQDTLASMTKSGLKLGVIMGTAALEVEGGVKEITRHIEELYYSSRRAGMTAANYKAIGQAATSIGISADDMGASLKSVAATIRSNPAMLGFINQFGVPVKGRDVSQVAIDFVGALKKMGPAGSQGYAVAEQIAAQVGITKDLFFQLSQPGAIEKLKAEQEARTEAFRRLGIDYDEAGKASVEFQNKTRTLGFDLSALGARIGMDMLPIADRMLNWAREGVHWFGDLYKQFDGTPGRIAAITSALAGGGGAWAVLAKLFGMAGPGAATAAAAPYVAGALGVAGAGALSYLGHGAAMEQTGGTFYDPETGSVINGNPSAPGAGSDRVKEWIKNKPFLMPSSSDLPRGLRQNNPGNLRSWGNAPIEGGFARFESSEQGLSALAGQLMRYGGRGWDSIKSIISHYAPSSENDTGAYIKDVTRKMGVGAGERLNLTDPETLTRLMSAIIGHEQGQMPFGQDALMAAVRPRLGVSGAGGGGVQINQKTDIHVTGGGDAAAVGRSVASEQSRVNGDLIRNFASAVQ